MKKRVVAYPGAAARIFAVVMITICIAGCKGADGTVADPLAYRGTGFFAEVHGKLCGVEFAALISADAGEGDARRMRVEYTAPQSVSGLYIEQSGGAVTVGYGELSLPGDDMAAMLTPCRMLLPGDDACILSVTAEKQDGGDVTVIALSDGGRIVLDSACEFPKCIFREKDELYIDWFEPLRG